MKEYNDMSEHPTQTFSFKGECIWPHKMRIINQYILNQKVIVVDITSYHNIRIDGENVSCIDLDISGPQENIEALALEMNATRRPISSSSGCYEYSIEKEKP